MLRKQRADNSIPLKVPFFRKSFQKADYLLYLDGKAAGVIEAKKEGATLSGVEIQSDKYKHGLPGPLPAWFRPLPFCYQSQE